MAVVTLFACAVTSVVLYGPTKQQARQRIRRSLMASATTGSMLIDREQHARLRPGDENTPLYRQIKRALFKFKRANPGITEAYTMVKTRNPNILRFIVDACDPEDKNHDGKITRDEIPARIGEPYDISELPQMRAAFDHPTADTEPTTDKWGTWLSGYAPIRDKRGKAVAILGVDMTLAELLARERGAYWDLLRAMAIALLAALVMSLFVARMIARPLEWLTEAAAQVRNGNLDFRVEMARDDELGDLAKAFDEMVASLSRDTLTGLYNRRYFQDRLVQEIARARRLGQTLCAAVIDVDRFKAINDSLGHVAGDAALRQTADALLASARVYDVVARIGGDEFAVIFPETDSRSGVVAAERLVAAIREKRIPAAPVNDEQCFVTASGGLANYPSDAAAAETLLLAADLAMLRSKHISTGHVSCYDNLAVTPADFGSLAMQGMLQRSTWSALETLAAIVNARAPHVRAHSDIVARYCVAVAREMGLAGPLVEQAKAAGLLHDIGHIMVPDSILHKPGPLTPEEWDVVRQHPSLGATIVSKIPHLRTLVEPIRYHHEHVDGSGYPEGLRGDQIPILSRILAAADAYEAMTSSRIYRADRAALSPQQALQEIRELAGQHFDPRVVEALTKVVQDELAEASLLAQAPQDEHALAL
jgi:diguanylate cyclase (GGDEF)-like protein/putative nucleotidyltransferase with HDIG domain